MAAIEKGMRAVLTAVVAGDRLLQVCLCSRPIPQEAMGPSQRVVRLQKEAEDKAAAAKKIESEIESADALPPAVDVSSILAQMSAARQTNARRTPSRRMTRNTSRDVALVYIGLGANLGDRETTIRRALQLLESGDTTVVEVSTLAVPLVPYESGGRPDCSSVIAANERHVASA